jgi:hypothetical protein
VSFSATSLHPLLVEVSVIKTFSRAVDRRGKPFDRKIRYLIADVEGQSASGFIGSDLWH